MGKSDILPYEKEGQELTTLLRSIYNDNRNMVLGVLSLVSDYEEDVRALLSYIKRGNKDWKSVHEYALKLYDGHEHDDE